MQIKNKLVVFLTITMLLHGCGYKNIYQGGNLIEIKSIKTSGENRIGNKIKSRVKLISSLEGVNKINLDFKISKNKKVKEKDITEKVTKYEITLIAELELEEIKNNKKLVNIFEKKMQSIVGNSYSDTIANEKETIKNLTNKISEEVIAFLNIYFRNK